jgi:hypothetical protein
MNNLYDADILAWSERQAELLRRLARGERVNDADLDWPNIIAEIESVGRGELRAVRRPLFQAFVHDVKAKAWPLARDAPQWRADARGCRRQAAMDFPPSMRQRLDLARIYTDALAALPETMDGQPPGPVPAACTATIEDLLAERWRLDLH